MSINEATNKIVFPHNKNGEFDTLADAVAMLAKTDDTRYYIGDIMRYNIRYRDYLRVHGIDALIELMMSEAPALRADKEIEEQLRFRFECMGGVADYDIQCYDVSRPIPVLGKQLVLSEMTGRDIEYYLTESLFPNPQASPNEYYRDRGLELHLGKVYDDYPRFDSSDALDGRTYDNYLIRTSRINPKEMEELISVKSDGNFCKVHEHIPEHLLPILYYSGTGRYALLATKKEF